MDLASRRACGGVILESTFTSAPDVASRTFPFFPARLLMRTRLDAASKVGRIRAPILVIHGTADGIIPFELGRRLYELAPDPKEFYEIPGGDHNNTYIIGGKPYVEKLRTFVASVAKTKR